MNVSTLSREELEQEIERLQEESRLKTHWISLITHDSKEIFGTLLWLIEALKNGDISKEVFFDMLPEIQAGAAKNLKTVTDTTAWIKSQYGDFRPQYQDVNVHRLFLDLKKEQEKKLSEKELRLNFKGEKDLYVHTDVVLVTFILRKVIENAIQFSFTKSVIEFVAVHENQQLTIRVEDVGQGIPPQWREKVFSFDGPKFEGTAGEKGAGLSLKIVKEFAGLINAQIKIQSKEQGTTVAIHFGPKKN